MHYPFRGMLLTLALTGINLLLAVVEMKFLRIQSLDIAPIGIIILAQQGEGIILGSLFLAAPYAALNPHKLRFLWATLPLTILIGYLALAIESAYILLVLYHLILAGVALLIGLLTGSYLLFAGVNFVSNFVVARIYSYIS